MGRLGRQVQSAGDNKPLKGQQGKIMGEKRTQRFQQDVLQAPGQQKAGDPRSDIGIIPKHKKSLTGLSTFC